MTRASRLLFICVIVATILTVGANDNASVLDKIKTGLKYASDYLETAKDIADLVSKSLHKRQSERRGDDGGSEDDAKPTFGTRTLVAAFFRLLGLDSQKVTAIAVNSVIFLAQMISSLFDLKPPEVDNARSSDDDIPLWDPFRFIMENKNERIQDLISQAKNPKLPEQLIDKLDGFDSACIRLLMCKTSPVILAAQNSLKNKTQSGFHQLTAWLPSREEFEENSDECENQYTDCQLFPES